MYLKNKYTKWYFSIIENSKFRILPVNTSIEKHHILPKSLGGDNSKFNIANLTPREHFVCHFLLTKMTTGVNKAKMVNAALRLSNDKKGRCVNSKIYEIIKNERRAYLKTLKGSKSPSYGMKRSESTKKLQSELKKGKPLSEEHKQKLKGRIGPMLGKTHSDETKQKLSEFGKTRVPSEHSKKKTSETMLSANIQRSEETREKMRQSKLGILHPRKICEYCKKDTTVAMYSRWHGKKCKTID